MKDQELTLEEHHEFIFPIRRDVIGVYDGAYLRPCYICRQDKILLN